jgi:hypothetical protein
MSQKAIPIESLSMQERVISVLKNRGIKHINDLRFYTVERLAEIPGLTRQLAEEINFLVTKHDRIVPTEKEEMLIALAEEYGMKEFTSLQYGTIARAAKELSRGSLLTIQGEGYFYLDGFPIEFAKVLSKKFGRTNQSTRKRKDRGNRRVIKILLESIQWQKSQHGSIIFERGLDGKFYRVTK